jgi:hypothetical protein
VAPHAEGVGERAGVALRLARGVGRGHDRHRDALGPDRVDRQAGDERRVDPAREPEHRVREAVLLHVVVKAGDERGVDLGERVEEFGHVAAVREMWQRKT